MYFKSWSLSHGANVDKYGYLPLYKIALAEERAAAAAAAKLAAEEAARAPPPPPPEEEEAGTPAIWAKRRGRHKYVDSLVANVWSLSLSNTHH